MKLVTLLFLALNLFAIEASDFQKRLGEIQLNGMKAIATKAQNLQNYHQLYANRFQNLQELLTLINSPDFDNKVQESIDEFEGLMGELDSLVEEAKGSQDQYIVNIGRSMAEMSKINYNRDIKELELVQAQNATIR